MFHLSSQSQSNSLSITPSSVQMTGLRDPNMFTNETLAGFDGVMFVSNSDEGESFNLSSSYSS